jgi:hypothetical protein
MKYIWNQSCAPWTLDIDNRCKQVHSFTPCLDYSQAKNNWYPFRHVAWCAQNIWNAATKKNPNTPSLGTEPYLTSLYLIPFMTELLKFCNHKNWIWEWQLSCKSEHFVTLKFQPLTTQLWWASPLRYIKYKHCSSRSCFHMTGMSLQWEMFSLFLFLRLFEIWNHIHTTIVWKPTDTNFKQHSAACG